jgi:hypothetical protein
MKVDDPETLINRAELMQRVVVVLALNESAGRVAMWIVWLVEEVIKIWNKHPNGQNDDFAINLVGILIVSLEKLRDKIKEENK